MIKTFCVAHKPLEFDLPEDATVIWLGNDTPATRNCDNIVMRLRSTLTMSIWAELPVHSSLRNSCLKTPRLGSQLILFPSFNIENSSPQFLLDVHHGITMECICLMKSKQISSTSTQCNTKWRVIFCYPPQRGLAEYWHN